MKFKMGRLILLFISFSFFNNCYSQNLSQELISNDLSKMSISKDFSSKIVYISKVINNLCIVSIIPPYREFPNVLIYKYDEKNKEWIRVFEGLSIGLQPTPSGLTDLHTIGYGIDFTLNNDSTVALDNVKNLIDESIKKNSIIIPYQNFLHMHTSPTIKAFYTIDKTAYFNIANLIYNKQYLNYPKYECTMFDTPTILKTEFLHFNDMFEVKIETSNQQLWIINFKGIDTNNKYLIDKIFKVKKLN